MTTRHRYIVFASVAIAMMVMVCGCASTRHVPDGQLLLNSAKIDISDSNGGDVTAEWLDPYLRQHPNHKILWFAKLQLGIYNMSGRDSTKWYNRWVRRLGEAPVIYDRQQTEQSRRQLELALNNRGYNDASVVVDTMARADKKKMDVVYRIDPGQPHYIETISYEFDDPALGRVILADTASLLLSAGDPLNRNLLNDQRSRLVAAMRDKGYYAFNNDLITFVADTVAGEKGVGLTMRVRRPERSSGDAADASYEVFKIARVVFVTDGDRPDQPQDTVRYKDITVIYGKDRYLRPSLLDEMCFIKPGQPYNAADVSRTYESLSRLEILKYVNIAFQPVSVIGNEHWLDAVITLSRTRKQGVSFEIDGTNSEGDLGFGVGVTYRHRDLAHGAEVLTAKFRGAYESLSGNFDGLINDRYTEFNADLGITFPKFEAPFLSRQFKQRVKATTEFALAFSHQERPEYTRIIAGAAWKYRWVNPANTVRQNFDLVDLSLVHLPKSTNDFINSIAPDNPLLRYSYEDHLIMRMGYSIYRTNHNTTAGDKVHHKFYPDIWTLRASAETAGNILYGLSSLFGQHREDGAYKLFNTPYAQYAKAEADYARVHYFTRRSSLAWHVGAGVAVPYGNSSVIPFEKRFYAGGANSVRGWGVRTLGPGSYDSRNSISDYINQCGDIRLDLNLEYRIKLFWVIEGAAFIDAGNVWTIRDYPNQPGGVFKFDRFYKQLAASYGLGARFDFTYFLLRLDLGVKAHNPAQGQEKWPLLHPRWGRDTSLHFSIGYPF